MTQKGDPYTKLFVTLFPAVRYSLHKSSETVLCKKLQFTVHVSPLFPPIGVEAKQLPTNSSYLSLVNFLLWRALQQKLYRRFMYN